MNMEGGHNKSNYKKKEIHMIVTIGNGSVRFESVKTEPFKNFET